LSTESLSSACSSLLEWSSTVLFIWLKGPFISRISFFWGFPYLCSTSLLYLVCLIYFIYLFLYSLLCFTLVFVEVISEFI
jgi:hypothetical protein